MDVDIFWVFKSTDYIFMFLNLDQRRTSGGFFPWLLEFFYPVSLKRNRDGEGVSILGRGLELWFIIVTRWEDGLSLLDLPPMT